MRRGSEATFGWPQHFLGRVPVRAYAYVDGFNLYYGCLKGTPYRWLDLRGLVERLLPDGATLAHLRYFTAHVSDRGQKAGSANRQRLYLRALRTLPNVDIIAGHFLSNPVTLPIHPPPPTGSRWARVLKTEEKGSDVNIAAWMLIDAVRNPADLVVLVSNDSDLETPVRFVREHFRIPVLLLPPVSRPGRRVSQTLTAAASATKVIRAGPLQASQFPDELRDARGTFRRPGEW